MSDKCRWCQLPSITDHNPEGILWVAFDQAEGRYVACASHLGKAVIAAHENNIDRDAAIRVYLYEG